MNANTLKAIQRHGESLLAAFPNATEKDPVALCKKLRRIETSLNRPLCDYCNGENGMTVEKVDAICEKAKARLLALLVSIPTHGINGAREKCPDCGTLPGEGHTSDCKGGNHIIRWALHINRDPRGCALKLDDAWTRDYNNALHRAGKGRLAIHRDMGGYGILAPDLNQ